MAEKITIAIAALVVVAGGGAAYMITGGAIPFVSDSDEMIDDVPGNVDVVMSLDAAVAENETTKKLVNGFIDVAKNKSNGGYTGPDTYEETLALSEDGTELDPKKLDRVVLFGKITDSQSVRSIESGFRDGYTGVLIESSWDEHDVIDAAEKDTKYEKSKYEGYTVYKQTSGENATWIGVIDDGKYVIGTENAVTDALDVQAGNQASVSGELRQAYHNTRNGYLKFAITTTSWQLNSGIAQWSNAVQSVRTISGAYYANGDDTIGIQLQIQTDSSNDAAGLKSQIEGGISFAEQGVMLNELTPLLDNIELSQNGDTVRITLEAKVESVVGTVEAAGDVIPLVSGSDRTTDAVTEKYERPIDPSVKYTVGQRR